MLLSDWSIKIIRIMLETQMKLRRITGMRRIKIGITMYLVALLALLAVQAGGQLYRNEAEIRKITRDLSTQVDNFRNNLSYELRRNGDFDRDEKERLEDDVRSMEYALEDFKVKFDRQRETAADVEKILKPATSVNDVIRYKSVARGVDRDWESLTGLLDRLASNYGVFWDANGSTRKTTAPVNDGLAGVYTLDTSRSENPREIADRAIEDNDIRNAEDRSDLVNKLKAPSEITFRITGNQVTIETSDSPQISFVADGRERVQSSGGETVRVRSTLRGEELTISSFGSDSDYTVTFASVENGRSMRVTRRFTTDYLDQTVFLESVYSKTGGFAANDPVDPGYSSNDPDDDGTAPVPGRTGDYVVPDQTVILGVLDTGIDTKVSQNNDKFRVSVTSPNQYRGAVIEGYLSGIDRSGRISGRSEVTFNFQTIRLTTGEIYDFAGFLQAVRDEDGNEIKVDEEGTAKGGSQTKETVKRSGIGAGIGALIGAIAGGAKGAAIGAAIGGGAGAGSVILQGKGDLKLKAGSEVTIKASSPIR